jgi:hypothetical protein
VAFMQELPFQEGRPLSPIEEEGESSTELLGHSRTASHLLDRQVCMASLRNTEEDDLDCRILPAENAKRAQRRRNTQNRTCVPRDLNNTFAAVTDCEYHTPIGAIAEAALLGQQLPSNPQIQRLQYMTQRALV